MAAPIFMRNYLIVKYAPAAGATKLIEKALARYA
jgi:hypothetical protein